MTEREHSEQQQSSYCDKTDSEKVPSIREEELGKAPEFPVVAVSLPKHVVNERYRGQDSSTENEVVDYTEAFPAGYNVYGEYATVHSKSDRQIGQPALIQPQYQNLPDEPSESTLPPTERFQKTERPYHRKYEVESVQPTPESSEQDVPVCLEGK